MRRDEEDAEKSTRRSESSLPSHVDATVSASLRCDVNLPRTGDRRAISSLAGIDRCVSPYRYATETCTACTAYDYATRRAAPRASPAGFG